jgi:hypothetical protein
VGTEWCIACVEWASLQKWAYKRIRFVISTTLSATHETTLAHSKFTLVHHLLLVRHLTSELGILKIYPQKAMLIASLSRVPHSRYYGIPNGIAPSYYCTFSSIEPNIPNRPYGLPCPSPSQVRSLSKYIVACDEFVLSFVTSGDGTPNLAAGCLGCRMGAKRGASQTVDNSQANFLTGAIPNAPMRRHILKYRLVMYYLNAFEQ